MENFSHFRLRLPNDLKQKLETEAKNNKRSINAQILYMLNDALIANSMKAEIFENLNELALRVKQLESKQQAKKP
ncbi:hypothetical protein COMNV_00446 [Commensalibacter sp. Nvir]|uniref:Arc family DNA-binding protein n=1 Tax=Commensalibacter sp. Nvir TaxID=3069817 RepID=UPI002D28615E|nr:hypothetical protein COMNV_00446 [Commensalibacter sp. Nvir]